MKIRKCISALLAIAFAITVFPAAVFAVGATETVTIDNGIGITAETTDSDIAASWGEGVATVTANSDGTYTVRLLKNIILRDGAVTPITFGNYSDGAEQPMMILDLNGCTVTGKTIIISNYGNLTITDSVGGGRVTYNNPSGYLVAVQNAGYNMIINSGEFECIGAGSVSYSSAISSTATSNTVINGGTFICENSGAIAAYGSITVNGGTFNGAYGVVAKQHSSDASAVSSIAFPSGSTAVVNADSMAFVVLTGGSTPEGVITVSAGAFNAPQVVGKTGSGDVTDNVFISGGTFTADPTEFVSENSPLAKITKSGVATYAIGGDISGAATGTVPGDTVEVLSGSIALQGLAHGVTVTNSGTGNVSANGTPVGSTSIEVHNLTHYEAVLPTHLTTGNIEYWYCGDCGKYFSDAGITEIPQKQTITDKTPEHAADGTGYHYDSNGHWLTCACGSQFDYAAHNLVFVVDVYATDSFNGYGHYECTDCDYESGRVTTYPAQTEPDTPSDPDDTVIVDEEEIEIEDPIEGGFAQTELVVLR